jgi:hypothetical protein
MQPAKRPRGDVAVLRELTALSGGSRAGLARVLRSLQGHGHLARPDELLGSAPVGPRSASREQRAVEAALAEAALGVLDAPTAAGPVVVSRGGLEVVRLQSLLQLLCHQSAAFFDLLARTSERAAGGRVGVIIHTDEIKPGNPLRPDPARSSWAVYAQLSEVPLWARSCTAAALPLCVVRTQELARLGGPPSP